MDKLKAILTGAKDYGLRGFKMFQENKMSVYSGYATLFIVTAVFPCAMLIISVVNLLPGYSTKDVTDILFQILPDLGPIKELIETSISNLKAQSGGLLASAAALTTLWSASKGVTSIQKGLNQLDEEKIKAQAATREDASLKGKAITYAKSTTKQLLFTLTVVILIPALLVFEMLGDSIVGIIDNILGKLNPTVSDVDLPNIGFFFNISALVVVLFALLVIVQIYATLPDIKRTMKSQLPGALITGEAGFCSLNCSRFLFRDSITHRAYTVRWHPCFCCFCGSGSWS